MTSEQRIAEWAQAHFGENMIEWAEKIGLEKGQCHEATGCRICAHSIRALVKERKGET